MAGEFLVKLIGSVKAALRWGKLLEKKNHGQNLSRDFQLPNDIDFCHKNKVHIFVRGMADGKLHAAKNRYYGDVRFYKKENLKVFCTTCRKRVI